MENMDNGLKVPKCVLTNWPKIPKNLSAQAQKFGISIKKRLHLASEVRDLKSIHYYCPQVSRFLVLKIIKNWHFLILDQTMTPKGHFEID